MVLKKVASDSESDERAETVRVREIYFYLIFYLVWFIIFLAAKSGVVVFFRLSRLRRVTQAAFSFATFKGWAGGDI